MFRGIDRSTFLLRAIEGVSKYFAQRRGLLMILGALLILVGFILELINVFAQLQFISVAEVILRNVGLLTALIGILISEPLGS